MYYKNQHNLIISYAFLIFDKEWNEPIKNKPSKLYPAPKHLIYICSMYISGVEDSWEGLIFNLIRLIPCQRWHTNDRWSDYLDFCNWAVNLLLNLQYVKITLLPSVSNLKTIFRYDVFKTSKNNEQSWYWNKDLHSPYALVRGTLISILQCFLGRLGIIK